MGLETLDGFRDRLQLALGDKAQFNERLDRWINDGIVELFIILDLENRRKCAQTTTVIDQDNYLLPVDLIAMLVLTDRTKKRRILKTSIENFERLDAAKTGDPKVFARVDRLIFLHPIPFAENLLHMFYVHEPTTLASGTDVSELTRVYDRVIHLLALRSALLDLGESDRATLIFQTAQNLLRLIPSEEWLEGQMPAGGVEIARSAEDLTKPPSSLETGTRFR